MTLTVIQKVAQLKAERQAHQEQAIVPVSSHTPEFVPGEPQVVTTSLFGGLIKFDTVVPAPQAQPQDNTAALATQARVAELNTVIAGQSAELAQLRQALLVLAQSAKSVELSNQQIVDGIAVIKDQTKVKVRAFDDLVKEIHGLFMDIVSDTDFFNSDVKAVTVGRGLRSILSFGTAAPEAIHAAKREVFAHMKTVRAMLQRMETLYEYACANYPNETTEWVFKVTTTLTVNKKSWSFLDLFAASFLPEFNTQLYKLRGLPT
jgi:uncharacterized coiled-coil protein SlyX